VAELIITYRGLVYPWQCDHMGHQNVTWYVAKFDEATWQMFAAIGITPSYIRDQKRGVAAVRQNITYRKELLPGDLVTIYSGVLEIKDKTIRFYHQMLNDETGEVAATAILTGIHMDIRARKACPFPQEIITLAQDLIVDNHLVI